jgi:hypothetical protein
MGTLLGSRCCLVVLALSLCVLRCNAATVIEDLRLLYGHDMGNGFRKDGHAEVRTPTTVLFEGNSAMVYDLSEHTRYAVGYYRSLGPLEAGVGSFLWGMELARDRVYDRRQLSSTRIDQTAGTSMLLDGFAGWAWQLPGGFHVEQGAILGLGETEWKQDRSAWYQDGARWRSTSHDFTYEYGFRVAAYRTFAEQFRAGVDLRYLELRSTAEFTGVHWSNGAPESVVYTPSIRVHGLGIMFCVAYRF